MQAEQDGNVERHPGQIEDRSGPAAGEKGPELLEVAERGCRAVPCAAGHAALEIGLEYEGAELRINAAADPREQARAHQLEPTLEQVNDDHQHDERGERRHAAAREHAVVNLQHEQGAGQHQHVDGAAEDRGNSKGALRRCKSCSSRMLRRLR
jgi:hypothetical protein